MKNIKSYYSSQNLYNTKKCLKNKCNAKYSVLCRKFAGETNYNIGMQAVSPLLFAAKYHRKTMGGMLCIYTPKEYIHNERSDYHILWQYIIAGELEGFIQKNSYLAIYYFTGISYSGQFWKFLQYQLHYLEFCHWFRHICMNPKPKILFSTSSFFYFQIIQSFTVTLVDIFLRNRPRSFLKTAMFETGVRHNLTFS